MSVNTNNNNSIIREYYAVIKNRLIQLRFDAALSGVMKLLQARPEDEQGYYYKGVCEFALEKAQAAIKSYNEAIKRDPGFAKAYFNLGICYFILKNYDSALINIAKALIIFSKRRELDKKKRCIEALSVIERERKR